MSARPAETAAWQSAQDAADDVMAQCAAMPSEHDTAVMAAYEGLPTVTTQDRTHGAGIPPADLGPELGSVTG